VASLSHRVVTPNRKGYEPSNEHKNYRELASARLEQAPNAYAKRTNFAYQLIAGFDADKDGRSTCSMIAAATLRRSLSTPSAG
jgi:hypothetical protein